MTQFRIVISARVTPLAFLTKALRERTWPRKATKTVTKDISMVFAINVHNSVAVEGAIFHPSLEDTPRPYRGW